jgi:hypothetical protein
MTQYRNAMPHGSITQVFPDVFFVTGSMSNEFFGSTWQFSRNMTIVREGDKLSIINSVRLDEKGLAELDALGKVVNVVRIGDMHGVDDPFYVQRYGATYWELPGMTAQGDLKADKLLVPGGEMPFSNCSLFVFETSKRPEAVLRLDREGGIIIACDALQNWVEPDEFCLDDSVAAMRGVGFFIPADLGPAWMFVCTPQAEDFKRFKQVPFKHVLCGHGEPLRDTAQQAYHATFARKFGV